MSDFYTISALISINIVLMALVYTKLIKELVAIQNTYKDDKRVASVASRIKFLFIVVLFILPLPLVFNVDYDNLAYSVEDKKELFLNNKLLICKNNNPTCKIDDILVAQDRNFSIYHNYFKKGDILIKIKRCEVDE